MNRTQYLSLFLLGSIAAMLSLSSDLSTTAAGEWMTYRSTYTHDAYGRRVDQHTRPVEPLSPDQGNLVRSGYRHYRSTIQGSTSADNLHITHEWGRPVMPYEHWRFPFRPYGSPYDQWGPPVPNVLSNFNVQSGGWPMPMQPNAPQMPPAMNPNAPHTMAPNNMAPNNMAPNNMAPNGMSPSAGYPSPYPYPYPYPNSGAGYPSMGYPSYPAPNAPWINGLYPSAPLR